MGEIVLAAKITHVPSMFISELPGENQGCRQPAIDALKRIGSSINAANTDTVIIADTHWLVNAGYHINANHELRGLFTSTEFPHFIQNLEYDYIGDAELGEQIAARASKKGTFTRCHTDVPSLGLQYGTLVPLKFMQLNPSIKVISIASWIYDADLEQSRIMGEAIAEVVAESDRRVAFLASGSLSHRIAPNEVVDDHLFKISSPFNKQTDLMVLELWREGRIAEFLEMLPQYAKDCDGEGGMHDTAMLFGLLGWQDYAGCGELYSPYFESSGTGQCNVVFPL
ncbi:MAG: 3,4-dihydroxyphenylacetate 2,3-dioxygenase [Halioglobus sp.]